MLTAAGGEQHDAPIKTIFFIDELQMLCTGSWDGSLRYWDLRQSTPAAVVQMPERVYCMDVLFPLAVVATAERKVLIYNLNNPKVEYKVSSPSLPPPCKSSLNHSLFPTQKLDSPLKYQSRSLACFPDKKGFALGSIEGRVAIHHVENADASYSCPPRGGGRVLMLKPTNTTTTIAKTLPLSAIVMATTSMP